MRLYFDAYASGHIRVVPATGIFDLPEPDTQPFKVLMSSTTSPYKNGDVVFLVADDLRVRGKNNRYRALTAADKRKVAKAHYLVSPMLQP